MRKTKKLLSIILSAALVATALPATALAADGASGNINGSGTIVDGLVYSVVVPSDLKFVVNPLKFSYTNPDGTLSSDQIISPGYGFANTSSVPVQLDVNVKVVSADGITIASAADQIKNSTNEAPTIYMDIEPATSEPTLVSGMPASGTPTYVSGTPLYVTFAGIDFVSGSALGTTDTTVSFKMNKANYALVGSNATYQNNDLSDDTVGFRFGGRASMFSDWENLEIGVSATYTINGISDEAFADSSNVTSGTGYNVLNKDLLSNVSFGIDNNNVLTVTGPDQYKDENGAFNAVGLYFVTAVGSAPVDMSGFTLTDAGIDAGVTVGDYTIGAMTPAQMTWDAAAGTITFNANTLSAMRGNHLAFFIKLVNSETGENEVFTTGDVLIQ